MNRFVRSGKLELNAHAHTFSFKNREKICEIFFASVAIEPFIWSLVGLGLVDGGHSYADPLVRPENRRDKSDGHKRTAQ